MGVLKHNVVFGNEGAAGYVIATIGIWRNSRKYYFMPYRSPGHYHLGRAIDAAGSAEATVEFWNRSVPVTVTNIAVRAIEMARKKQSI